MSSHYADYIKEREGFDIIEDQYGFATYKIFGEECYLRDIYVTPQYRRSSIAMSYCDQIEQIAKESGCKFLTGSIAIGANGNTESLKAVLAAGFKLQRTTMDGIILIKEIN